MSVDQRNIETVLALPVPTAKVSSAVKSAIQPKLVLMAVDLTAITLSIVLTYLIAAQIQADYGVGGGRAKFLPYAALTFPVWLGVFSHQRLYNTRFIGRRIDEIRRIVNAVIMGVLSVAFTGYLFGALVARSALIVLFVIAITLVTVEREIARRVFARLRHEGKLVRHVVIAGANPEGRELAAMLQAEPWLGYRVLGFVDDVVTDRQPVPGVPLLGTVADAGEIVLRHTGASVIVAASAIESETTNRLARELLERGIHVELSSTLRDIASQRLTVRPLGRFPVVYVEPVQRGGWRRVAKRSFDVMGAVVVLMVLSPVLLLAAIAIKLDSRGPVLFQQTRVGRDSRPFRVWKLRSMVPDAESMLPELIDQNEADGPLFKMSRDPRVTRIGRILRTSSIDELPQMWNVLVGEMSLVGPRPALPHETEAWDPLLSQRLRVKPGITGMWQVNGRSETSFDDYTRLDLYYVDNWSLLTDLAILFKTLPVVLSSRGAT